MNTQRELLQRLIKQYPVKSLKEEFGIKLPAESLYSTIISQVNQQIIKDFAYSNINLTKQHVYIFNIAQNFNYSTFAANPFPFNIVKQSYINNELTLIISPVVDFQSILSNPYEELIIQFYQPFIIKIKNKHLIYQASILERNISSYFEDERKVLDVEKANDEQYVIQTVNTFFQHLSPEICDLNRGIKRLWANDVIDSKYVKWKKTRSITTEAMDENFTLKTQYPNIYNELINAPLNRTIFKYLGNDEQLPNHFTTDPTNGQINIPTYSNNLNQIENVINEILSNN